jgi:hypothetical protein
MVIQEVSMSMDNMVVLTSFVNELDAQMVVMELQAAGIDAFIRKDDCGGMRPMITAQRGIEVMVPVVDAARAAEIMDMVSSEQSAAAASAPSGRRKLSKIDLTAMLVVGIIVGAIGTWGYVKDRYFPGKVEVDRNNDGAIDQVWFYDIGGFCTGGHEDNNFDGEWDLWYEYSDGVMEKVHADTDFNGIADVEWKYVFGITAQGNWRPNDFETVRRRVFFKHGVPFKELADSNRDGSFDMETTYDPFGNEISTRPIL